jgi:hypothetical protein
MKMRKITLVLGALLLAGGAFAQEARDVEEDSQPGPVKVIRVLENPYDIASFYRSAQGRYEDYPVYPGLDSGYGGYAAPVDPRYPIAGYYRQGAGFGSRYGYSAFWMNGYRSGGYGAGGHNHGYRRRIGQNGDLFLLAPTFLASVGPLSGAFFDAR